MSLHWTIIAGFLYGEIAAVLLLLIPFISPRAWNKLFKSRLLKGLENQLIYYFYVLVTILVLFFLDAFREVHVHQDDSHDMEENEAVHLDVKLQTHMLLYRAQTNFYISGFALFLCPVIRRLVSLLSRNACLEAEKEAAMKQAQSASRAAETLMKGDGDSELQEKLTQKEAELSKALKDVASMKNQAENLSAEYDRLCDEKNSLERKLAIQGTGDKKDD